MLLSSSADFFEISFFKEFFQEHYQTVKLFRSRAVLTWVKLVCKDYHDAVDKKVTASKERVKSL